MKKKKIMSIISLAVIVGLLFSTGAWAVPGNKSFLPPGLQKKDKPLPPPFQHLRVIEEKEEKEEKTVGEVIIVEKIGGKTWVVIREVSALKALELPENKGTVQVGDRVEVRHLAGKITHIEVKEEAITKMSFNLRVNPKEVVLGDKVYIAFEAKNNTSQTITQQVASGKIYDFVISRNGQKVWQWSDDYSFIQATQQLVFNPGDALSAAVDWQPNTIGTYKVEAFFFGESDKPVAIQEFTVVTR